MNTMGNFAGKWQPECPVMTRSRRSRLPKILVRRKQTGHSGSLLLCEVASILNPYYNQSSKD